MKIKYLISWLIVFFALWLGMLFYMQTGRPSTLAAEMVSLPIIPIIDLPEMPSFFTYSLSDGLWAFALGLVILIIWEFRLTRTSLWWYGLAFIMALTFELLQLLQQIPGVYDHNDMVAMIIGFSIPLFISQKIKVA